jgi:Phosphoinositide phospholipase C, Ca2+-dependent
LSATVGLLLASFVFVPTPAASSTAPRPLRLNDVQIVGTHNSYHIEPSPQALARIMSIDPELVNLAYTHPPLGEQLQNERIRQVELDVFADPAGNLWRPIGTPGFKVFHMEQVDMSSSCEVFVQCLHNIEDWSLHHRRHLPVFVLIQPNDEIVLPEPPNPVAITTPVLDALDAEIRSVIPAHQMITPDEVRGTYPSLEAAVLAGHWPTLQASRGKLVFLALGDYHAQYIAGHPNLEGRTMFMASSPGQPDAAFINIDDPRGANQATIQSLVRKGYLVRTRADDSVTTPLSDDTTQRDAAFASGAQIVSTDYPYPWSAYRWNGSAYFAQLPGGGIGRCDPIRTSAHTCRQSNLGE